MLEVSKGICAVIYGLKNSQPTRPSHPKEMIGINGCCVVSEDDDVQLNEGEKSIVIWLVANQVVLFISFFLLYLSTF